MQILLFFLAIVVLAAAVGGLVSRRYSLPCPVWLRWMVELDNPFTKTNRAAVILEFLNIQPGMAIIDIGCGPGRLTIPAARATGDAGRVKAVDIQAAMLERAKVKAAAAHLQNIEFLCSGIGEDTLGHNEFDRALLVTVLGEIPDRRTAMKEIFAALKPGGLLSITEVIFDPHFQRRQTVTQLAESAGFQEKAFYGNAIAYTMHVEKPESL